MANIPQDYSSMWHMGVSINSGPKSKLLYTMILFTRTPQKSTSFRTHRYGMWPRLRGLQRLGDTPGRDEEQKLLDTCIATQIAVNLSCKPKGHRTLARGRDLIPTQNPVPILNSSSP